MLSISIMILVYLGNLYAFENNNIISCKTCKWFIKSKNGIDSDNLCEAFSKTTFQENKKVVIYEYAAHCRDTENMCGQRGKLYKDKNIEKMNNEKINKLQYRNSLLYDYYRFISNNDDTDNDDTDTNEINDTNETTNTND